MSDGTRPRQAPGTTVVAPRHMPAIVRVSCGSRPWKKCPQPGNTMTGSSCGRAHANTVRERHDVVLLAMDHDRVLRRPRASPMRVTAGPTSTRRSAAMVAATRVCTNEPNEKPASATGSSPKRVPRVRERGQRIVGLTRAVVERALGLADAAEIETHGCVAQSEKRLRERLRDLVVERAALQRMRMGDERNAARRLRRRVDDDLQRAGGAVDDEALGGLRRQITSLSTISPPSTWRSMISSMSARST